MKISTLKLLGASILLTFSQTSFANECPNLTGLFQMAEGAVIQYDQDACTSLARSTGFTRADGSIEINHDKRLLHLDGKLSCEGYRCISVTPTATTLDFTLNYDGIVKIPGRGLCQQSFSSSSIEPDGNLKTVYDVKNCDDGYNGQATKVFQRIL